MAAPTNGAQLKQQGWGVVKTGDWTRTEEGENNRKERTKERDGGVCGRGKMEWDGGGGVEA